MNRITLIAAGVNRTSPGSQYFDTVLCCCLLEIWVNLYLMCLQPCHEYLPVSSVSKWMNDEIVSSLVSGSKQVVERSV